MGWQIAFGAVVMGGISAILLRVSRAQALPLHGFRFSSGFGLYFERVFWIAA
jgi:hypothetical protein